MAVWDLAKSMLRFSWGLSLFGAQQAANLSSPSKAAKVFAELAKVTETALGGPLGEAFRAGDALQGRLVDGLRSTLGGLVPEPAIAPVAPPAPLPARLPGPPGPPGPAPVASPPAAMGWGPMPDPGAAAAGPPAAGSVPPPASAQPAYETDISPEFPYQPHFVDVLGSRMHYIEQGAGEPILLLHGNPSWSYIWRNIVPHLSSLGRCIAPDLIGFGRSAKPEIQYQWTDHVDFLEAFIEKLDLRNVTLVLHDQGSGLGFHYAMRHEQNVKRIAFFEAIVRPYPWDQFSTPEFRQIFRLFRTGGVGGVGWQMIVDQNVFIEQLLPQAAGRPLSALEMSFYREPFVEPPSRLPVWVFPRETPIGGEPVDVWNAVAAYSAKLQRSALPKLMLYATPGALLTAEHVAWCQQNIRNLESVYIGPGSHFLQESSPHRIGQEIADWCRRLDRSPGAAAAAGQAADPADPADPTDPIAALRAEVSRLLDSLDPDAPIAAIVIFKVARAKEKLFGVQADLLTAATRRMPGVNVFAFHQTLQPAADDPSVEYLIYEDWQTRDLFRAQWDSAHLARFQGVVSDFVLAPPDLRFYHGWYEYRGGGGEPARTGPARPARPARPATPATPESGGAR